MNYFYPQNVVLTYTSSKPNLHVRAFLHERLECNKSKAKNPSKDNAWRATNVSAGASHGGAHNKTEPLLLARQERLDSNFRDTSVYFYSVCIPQPKPGTYVAEIVAYTPDVLTQGNGTNREIGEECGRERQDFVVQYSEFDRLLCDGKTANAILQKLYQTSLSEGEVRVGTADKDWVLEFPNVKDGEKIRVTYRSGQAEDFIGKYFEGVVTNGKITFQGAPEGDYKIEFLSTGDVDDIRNPNC